MTKKELLNKIEKQQEIIDALFSELKLGYREEEYIQKSFLGESKIKTRIVVSKNTPEALQGKPATPWRLGNLLNANDNVIKKYKSNGRKTTHNKTK